MLHFRYGDRVAGPGPIYGTVRIFVTEELTTSVVVWDVGTVLPSGLIDLRLVEPAPAGSSAANTPGGFCRFSDRRESRPPRTRTAKKQP